MLLISLLGYKQTSNLIERFQEEIDWSNDTRWNWILKSRVWVKTQRGFRESTYVDSGFIDSNSFIFLEYSAYVSLLYGLQFDLLLYYLIFPGFSSRCGERRSTRHLTAEFFINEAEQRRHLIKHGGAYCFGLSGRYIHC